MKTVSTALLSRLAAKRSGSYRSPFALSYSSRWGGTPFNIEGYRHTFGRWHESPETPFRFIGLASDIVRLGHTGWYTRENDCDETARGVVYMLPHGRFLAAIADPFQSDKDGSGPCIVETNATGQPIIYDSKEDAARAADSFAERYAEAARESDHRECERMKLEDAASEAAETLETNRSEARALLAEIRASRLSPGLCERMRGELRALRRSMHAAFATIKSSNAQLAAI
jgi:hypothetical protein